MILHFPVSGASTITQQLSRALLFSPEERVEQSYQRKIREAILAAEVTRRYSKEEILELYLNENYYGNLAYGIEAAAQTYFNTTADKLTLAQAAFLAGLPQAPAVYDIHTNREVTLHRMEQVLYLMYEQSQVQGCIYISNSPQSVCVDAVDVANSVDEISNYEFIPSEFEIRYPHWVTHIRNLLEQQYDPQTIYRSGFSVYTTLDPGLQDHAERIVEAQVARLRFHHRCFVCQIGNGADALDDEVERSVCVLSAPKWLAVTDGVAISSDEQHTTGSWAISCCRGSWCSAAFVQLVQPRMNRQRQAAASRGSPRLPISRRRRCGTDNRRSAAPRLCGALAIAVQ